MTAVTRTAREGEAALARLREREEILQICYWYEGERLGPRLTADAVLPFMASEPALVREVFDLLVAEGDLVAQEGGFAFTVQGRKKAARLFAEAFTEFQLGGHGECTAGCCDEDETCEHGHAHVGHVHGHSHGHT